MIDKAMFKGDEWRLLRPGDRCIVRDMGIEYIYRVESFLHLSNGKVLVRTINELNQPSGLFLSTQVFPYDSNMVSSGLTSYELILRKFEPKGKSTYTTSSL